MSVSDNIKVDVTESFILCNNSETIVSAIVTNPILREWTLYVGQGDTSFTALHPYTLSRDDWIKFLESDNASVVFHEYKIETFAPASEGAQITAN